MRALRFFTVSVRYTLGKFCQQRWLLAGLILLCFLLPLAAGQAAGRLLSQGVDFSGVTLAISAPEGDDKQGLAYQLAVRYYQASCYGDCWFLTHYAKSVAALVK